MRRTRSKPQLADLDPTTLASSLSEAFGAYVPPHSLAAFLAFAAPGQENAAAPVAPSIPVATGPTSTLSPGGRRRSGGSRVLQMPSTALSGLRNATTPHPERPHPVPLRHSVSDIAEAFNLESTAPQSSASAPFLLTDDAISPAASPERHSHMSPSRMTRSRSNLSCSTFSSWPSDQNVSSHGGSSVADTFEAQRPKAAQHGGGGFSGVPLQPTLSMVDEGLEALEAVGSPGSLGSPDLVGSPMRRTRSRGHPPALPLQRDMSNISVSDFFAGIFGA